MKILLLVILAINSTNVMADELISMRAALSFTECARQQDNTLDCKDDDASLEPIEFKLISTGPGSPAMGSREIYSSKGRYAYALSVFVKRDTKIQNAPYELSVWFSSMYDGDPKTQRLHVLGGAEFSDTTKIPSMYFNAEDLEDRGIIYRPTIILGPKQ